MAADTHKYIGDHAEEIAGLMRAPGDLFTLTKEHLSDLHIKEYIKTGKLLELKGGE